MYSMHFKINIICPLFHTTICSNCRLAYITQDVSSTDCMYIVVQQMHRARVNGMNQLIEFCKKQQIIHC